MRITVFDYIKVILKVFIIVTHVGLITTQMRHDLLFPFWIDQAVPPFWIISTFLLAWSFERHGSHCVKDEYGKTLTRRLMRVAVPYTAVFILMVLLTLYRGDDLQSFASSVMGLGSFRVGEFLSLILLWLSGGAGPGGYYVAILFQMYVLFPPIYVAFRKRPLRCTAGLIGANLAWEILFWVGFVSDQAYRLLIIRYLTYMLLGIVFYRLWAANKLSITGPHLFLLVVCFALGACYLLAINYFGFPPLGGGTGWKNTSWIVALYSGSIFYLLLTVFGQKTAEHGGGSKASSRRVSSILVRQRFISTSSRCSTTFSLMSTWRLCLSFPSGQLLPEVS